MIISLVLLPFLGVGIFASSLVDLMSGTSTVVRLPSERSRTTGEYSSKFSYGVSRISPDSNKDVASGYSKERSQLKKAVESIKNGKKDIYGVINSKVPEMVKQVEEEVHSCSKNDDASKSFDSSEGGESDVNDAMPVEGIMPKADAGAGVINPDDHDVDAEGKAEENEAEENEAEENEKIFDRPIKLDENSPEVICMNLPGHFDSLMKEIVALKKCGNESVKKLAENILSKKMDIKDQIQKIYNGCAIIDPSAKLNAGEVDPFARSKLLAIAKLTRPLSKDLRLWQLFEVSNLFQQSGFTDLIRTLDKSKNKKLVDVAKRFEAIVIGTQRFFLGQMWRYTELVIDKWDKKPVGADTVISGISDCVRLCLRCLLASMGLRLGSDEAVSEDAKCEDMPNIFCFQKLAKLISGLKDKADMKRAYDHLNEYVSNISNLVLIFLINIYKCNGPVSDILLKMSESGKREKPMKILWQTCIDEVGPIYEKVYDCTVGEEELTSIRVLYKMSLKFALEGLDISSPFEGIDFVSNDEWLHPRTLPSDGGPLEDGIYVSRYKDSIMMFNRVTLIRENGDVPRKLKECFVDLTGDVKKVAEGLPDLFEQIYDNFKTGKKIDEYKDKYKTFFKKTHPDKLSGIKFSEAQDEILSRARNFVSQVGAMEKERVFPGEEAWDKLDIELEDKDGADETGLVKKRKEFGFYESKPKKAKYSEEELQASSGVVNVQGW